MATIKLSIIIPYFEIPEAVDRLIDSIPERDDIEVIVVDDQSKENVEKYEEVKNKYSDRHIVFLNNDKEKGAGNSRNVGIEQSHGEWFLFADADDYYDC